ncbi:MAG: prenyltransferase/squalene oxidase repeat-containing protein [Chloroflexota bacterium]
MKKRLSTLALAWLAAMLTLVYVAGGALAAPSASPYGDSASTALKWIATQQSPDGSFAGFGAGSTVDAVLSIVAAGGHADSFAHGYNAVTFLQDNAGAIAKTAGGAGKLLVAVSALGQSGKSFGGVDLVGAINATYGISATGRYGPDALGHAFAILGLHSAGEAVPADAVAQLESLQTSDGGWAFTGDTAPGAADTNTTAVAVQALIAAGATGSTLDKGTAYLASQQNDDGGWPYQKGGQFGSESDVNSTSYVVQAMLAVKNAALVEAGQSYIVSLQNPSGAFPYQKSQPDDNPGATYQAIAALLGATLVVPEATAEVALTATPLATVVSNPAAPTPVAPGMPVTGAGADWLSIAALVLAAFALSATGLAISKSTTK